MSEQETPAPVSWFRKLPAPRDALFLVVAMLLTGLAGYSVGRFTGPREVEERFEYSQLEQRKEKKKTKTKRAVDTTTTTTPIAVATPDGGFVIAPMTVTRHSEREESEEKTKLEAMREAIGRSTVTTTNQPSWAITALGGARFAPTGVTGLGTVQGSRRIAGGVSGVVQLSLEVDPKAPQPIVGGQVQGGISIELP